MTLRSLLPLWFALSLSCGSAADDPEPITDDATAELASFAHRKSLVLEHGELPLDSDSWLELTRGPSQHKFALQLAAPNLIRAHAELDATRPRPSVHLKLTRIDASGARQVLAYDGNPTRSYRSLERELPAGRYELELYVFAPSSASLTLRTRCISGPSCAPASACRFGAQFGDLRASSRIEVLSEQWHTNLEQLDSREQEQLILAVHQSSHDDVTTAEEALSRVDQEEVRVMELRDRTDDSRYTVFEYGAGDNSYGAIFQTAELTIAASIHDGDLLDCHD